MDNELFNETTLYLCNVPFDRFSNDVLYIEDFDEKIDYFSRNAVHYTEGGIEKVSCRFDMNYLRKNSSIKVDIPHWVCEYANYCYYYNPIDHRYYFNWIDDIKYINPDVTEITISIDVFQTYQYDYGLIHPYIERQIVSRASDVPGAYTLPEGLETGEMIIGQRIIPFMFNFTLKDVVEGDQYCYIIAVSQLPRFGYDIYGYLIGTSTADLPLENQDDGGLPTGQIYLAFDNVADYKEALTAIANSGQTNTINNVFVAPSILINNLIIKYHRYGYTVKMTPDFKVTDENGNFIEHITFDPEVTYRRVNVYYVPRGIYEDDSIFSYTFPNELGFVGRHGDLSYTPRNKKLLTGEFCKLEVDNNCGDTMFYERENCYYDNILGSIGFKWDGIVTPSCQIKVYPLGYKELIYTGDTYKNYDNAISIANFPIGDWDSDVYTNWLIQNTSLIRTEQENSKQKYILDQTLNDMGLIYNSGANFSSMLGGLFGGSTGNAMNSYGKFVANEISMTNSNRSDRERNTLDYENKLRSLQAQQQSHSFDVGNSLGNANNGDIVFGKKLNRLDFKYITIKPEYAKRIDIYFDMFGYRVDKIVNVYVAGTRIREYYDYIKVANCTLSGSIPDEQKEELRNLYMRGLRIWYHPDHFVDYSVDNVDYVPTNND